MKNLVDLFCDVDDFCQVFEPQWQTQLIEDKKLTDEIIDAWHKRVITLTPSEPS